MCGRFVLAQHLDHWVGLLDVDEVLTDPLPLSWNVAPTDPVYAVAEHGASRQLGTMGWGMVAHWAKDTRSRQINARSETAATAPMFREAFSRRRCLVPSDGFYEWQASGRGKIPHHISLADGPMVFAGIWSGWTDPASGERTRSLAILTADARPDIAGIHDRMPVWLAADLWADWLDPALTNPADVTAILEQRSSGTVVARPVDDAVGSVRNNHPGLLAARKDLFS